MAREVSEADLDDSMVTHFIQNVAGSFLGLSDGDAYNLSAQLIERAMSDYRRNPSMAKIQVSVELGIKSPEFLERMVTEQNERLVKLGVDPLHVFSDRLQGGD